MIWLVLPWLVFAVAVGFKAWKLTRLILKLFLAYSSRPQRHRLVNHHAAANALVLQERDFAQTVALNISCRLDHPREEIEQITILGTLQSDPLLLSGPQIVLAPCLHHCKGRRRPVLEIRAS
jgi:hypothetical protein